MKKSVKRILMSVIVAIGLVASVGLGFFMSVQAATAGYITMGEESALLNCYMKVDAFKSPVYTNSFTNQLSSHGMDKFMNTSTEVFIPVGLNGNDITENCSKTVQGLLGKNNMTIPNQTTKLGEIEKFLGDIGYTNESKTSSNGKCVSFMYNIKETTMSDPTPGVGSIITISSDSKTPTFCAEKITNGKIDVDKLEVNYDGVSEDVQNIIIIGDASGGRLRFYKGRLFSAENLLGYIDYKGMTWENFKKELEEFLRNNRNDGYINPLKSYKLIDGSMDESSYDGTTGEYIIDKSKTTIIGGGVNKLLGRGNGTYPIFSEDDKFSLYTAYMIKVFSPTGDFMKCGVSDKEAEELTKKGNSVDLNTGEVTNKNYKKIKRCNGDKVEVCYAKVAPAKEDIKVGRVADNMTFDNGECDWDCVAEGLADYEGDTCPEDAKSSGSTPGGSDKKDDRIVDCNDLTTIGAMQWVLCPTMNNMQYTANALDKVVEDQLKVKIDMYDMDGETGGSVYEAWGYIRNIANVLMIIFLLIVIFSQITGRGIDNYGIKKMLPKLIVMAIVVNLSYYVCVIAIDLSNIFGVGLRDMFGALGEYVAKDPKSGLSFTGGMITAAFAAAPAIAGGASAGMTLTALTASMAIPIVIAVIVALFLIVVAIFTLFAMLGVRQMIVIACLMLSPLAFVAYILPNTQNLFKSWWNLFKAAIIIFPICGLFSGISNLLKNTVGKSPNLGLPGSLVMMVLPYVVFFLIPMVLKNAIAALGKIGGALTALGGTVKSGAQTWGKTIGGVAKNTEAYKNRQLEIAKRRQAKSADRTIAKLGEIKEENLSPEEKLRLARAHEMKRKLAQEDTAAETILMEKKYAGMSETALLKGLRTAIDNGDAGNIKALSNVLVSRGGNGAINKIGNMIGETEFFDKEGEFVGGDNGAMARSFNALRENLQENKTLNTGTLNKTSDVYQMLTGGGYGAKDDKGDKGEQRYNLDYHSAHNGLTTQAKDLATQSSDTIRRAIAGGGMSPELFNSVLTSEDPAIQSGILSEDSKANLLKAGSMGYAGDLSDAKAVAASAAKYDLAHPDASSVKFTGKQLADYSVDELRTLANRAINDGVGSEAYKKFVAASNEIAQSPDLLTNLSAAKKAEIHRVRIANNSNDRVFANNTEMNIDHRGNGADFISE